MFCLFCSTACFYSERHCRKCISGARFLGDEVLWCCARDLQEATAAVEAKQQLWEAQRPRILREIRRLRAERQKLRAVAGLGRP